MQEIIDTLEAQHSELRSVIKTASEHDWHRPTPCIGWDVGDVLLHMAQTDELAIASAQGKLDTYANGFLSESTGRVVSVDEAAAQQVTAERAIGGSAIAQRWDSAATALVEMFLISEPSRRVTWVSGKLSIQTLAATRLSECWIHTGDIAIALSVDLAPTDRLRFIARLAWRTLPYAFAQVGLTMSGPVELHLTAPSGEVWDYVPDDAPVTTIIGTAEEFCAVAARRTDGSHTSIVGTGPDVDNVLRLVRAYAQ